MSKNSDRTPMLRTITITNADGTTENIFRDVDCAIVCASIADSPKTEALLFSECNLPTILSVISSANKAIKSFKVGDTPVVDVAKLLGFDITGDRDDIHGDNDGDNGDDKCDDLGDLIDKLKAINAILGSKDE